MALIARKRPAAPAPIANPTPGGESPPTSPSERLKRASGVSSEELLYLRCRQCLLYARGRALLYPNTPEEKNTWRRCLAGCTVDAETVACRHFRR